VKQAGWRVWIGLVNKTPRDSQYDTELSTTHQFKLPRRL
jgi:hypothetical protein